MTIRIGYCSSPGQHSSAPLAFEPGFHPQREMAPSAGPLRRCPASIDYTNSAFNISLPYDLAFTIERDAVGNPIMIPDMSKTTLAEPIARQALDLLTDVEGQTAQLTVSPNWVFISDTPGVILTLTSAYDQTNPPPIRGQFNIYNWFRPISYAFTYRFGEPMFIQRNSPIYQVKFYHPTESRFVVSECLITKSIEDHHRGQFMRRINSLTNWTQVFQFAKNRRPKKVLQFISEQ